MALMASFGIGPVSVW